MRERSHGESKLRGKTAVKVVVTVVAAVLAGWQLKKRR